jgi:hypothetical protein
LNEAHCATPVGTLRKTLHAVAPYAFLFPDRLNRSDFSVLYDWRDRLMGRPAAVHVCAEDTDEVPRRRR